MPEPTPIIINEKLKTQESIPFEFEWTSTNPEFQMPTIEDFDNLSEGGRKLLSALFEKYFDKSGHNDKLRSYQMLQIFNIRTSSINIEGITQQKYEYDDFAIRLALGLIAHAHRADRSLIVFENTSDLNPLEWLKQNTTTIDTDPNKLFVSSYASKEWFEKRTLDIFYQYYSSEKGIKDLSINGIYIFTKLKIKLQEFSTAAKKYYTEYYKESFEELSHKAQAKLIESWSNNTNEEKLEYKQMVKDNLNQYRNKLADPKSTIPRAILTKYVSDANEMVAIGFPDPELVRLKNSFLKVCADYKRFGPQPLTPFDIKSTIY